MKTISRKLAAAALVLAPAVIFLMLSGCDGNSDIIRPKEDGAYHRIAGVLVVDDNIDTVAAFRRDSTRVAVQIFRGEDTLQTAASVSIGGADLVFDDSLFPVDSVYSFEMDALGNARAEMGVYYLSLVDSTLFDDSVVISVADSFSIMQVVPEYPAPNNGGDQIQVQWSPADGVYGYIVATTLKDSIYSGYGYSRYVNSQATQTTVPPDAFRMSGQLLPDTGMYYVYVYGYAGSPDSALSAALLPVPIPDQPADNFATEALTGRFGTVVVTYKDSVYVALQ